MKQRFHRFRNSPNQATEGRSRWFVGSSRSSTSGRWNRRPASTPRIFQPPDSSPRSRRSSPGENPSPARIASASCSPKNRSKWSIRSWSSPTSPARSSSPSSEAPSRVARSSSASADASRASSSARPGTLDRIMSISDRPPAIEMSCGSHPIRTPFARVTLPSSTSCSPAMILRSVVLPEPFGPISPIRSLCPRRSDAASKIIRSPKNSVTSSRTTRLTASG
jgi:hypothetical protein